MSWTIEWSSNGFCYVVERRGGKKLATVYGTIEQRAASGALMAAAPKMRQMIAAAADMLAEIDEIFETPGALYDAKKRALTHQAVSSIRRAFVRLLDDIGKAGG